MKAKEFAVQLDNSPTLETLAIISGNFIRESYLLIKDRSCKTDAAIIAVFDEQNIKWGAFARRVKTMEIRSDGYAFLIKQEFPQIFSFWQASHPNKLLVANYEL